MGSIVVANMTVQFRYKKVVEHRAISLCVNSFSSAIKIRSDYASSRNGAPNCSLRAVEMPFMDFFWIACTPITHFLFINISSDKTDASPH